MTWHYNPNEITNPVYDSDVNGNWPTGFTDLDLTVDCDGTPSGFVPAGQNYLVLIRMCPTSGWDYTAFRAHGSALNTYYGGAIGSISQGVPDGSPAEYGMIVTWTDTSGHVDWKCRAAITGTLHLVGWADFIVSGSTIFSGDAPSTFEKVSVAGTVPGACLGLISDRVVSGAGSNCINHKYTGDPETNGAVNDGRVVNTLLGTTTVDAIGMVPIDSSLEYSHRDENAVVTSRTITLIGYIPLPITYSLLGTYTITEAWQTISTGVTNRSLLLLKVKQTNESTSNSLLYFKSGDDPYDYEQGSGYYVGITHSRINGTTPSYVIVPTDSSGNIKWMASGLPSPATFNITIIQALSSNTPPVLGTGSPSGSEESPGVEVSITWTDAEGMSGTGTTLTLTDPESTVHNIITAGVFQSGWNGTTPSEDGTSGTVAITTHEDFMAGLWTADVTLVDKGALTDTANWSFTVVDRYYRNRVFDEVDAQSIAWDTTTPDTLGASYPGSGTFGVDTSDYCVENVSFLPKSYRNRAYDPIDAQMVFWETGTPDTTGASYPGSSAWEDVLDYCVEKVTLFNEGT